MGEGILIGYFAKRDAARRALKELQAGQVIRVQATDPGSKRDFEGWTGNTGNTLLESTEVDGLYTYVIRKGTQ